MISDPDAIFLDVSCRCERIESVGEVKLRLAVDVVEKRFLREQGRLVIHDPTLGATPGRQEVSMALFSAAAVGYRRDDNSRTE